jgi:hypothetical protein
MVELVIIEKRRIKMKKIINLRLVVWFLVTIVGSLSGPAFIQFKAQIKPDILSLLMIIPTSLSVLTSYVSSKMSTKTKLLYPPIIDIAVDIILSILLILDLTTTYIVIVVIVGQLITMIHVIRGSLVNELLKNKFDIHKFETNSMTVHGVGTIVGLALGAILYKFLSLKIILLICTGFSISANILTIVINNMILEYSRKVN